MNFAILGSLEVRESGNRIPITAPKQRAVLVTLLLDVNNEVPVERLIRYVWDGQPPAAAQTTLQSYIYRLRQLLKPVSGVGLETSSASYLLHVDPAQTDVWSFKQGVAEAAGLNANGELRESVRSLRAALALWRGTALVGVPGKSIQQEARLLEDERIAAYEDLFSTEILLGNHRTIVPELRKVVSRYQYHETLRAQLMVALYRAGRQAEALQVYAVIRRKLREDLGIDPGPELQELHKSILEQVPGTILLPPSVSV
ncbi:AfsR/SARP family transcriptional regulator [Luedemannella helvata]|uniref:AfsR/SARP family transcriptional regulator n=1 Tax=Luedemannella helvata TaxID=349315 RepID=UPI0031D13724